MEQQTDREQEATLDLDPGILEQNHGQSTSLEDIYSYPVFSEEFLQKMQKKREEQREQWELCRENVWEGQKKDEIEKNFYNVMEAETPVIVHKEYNIQAEQENGIFEMLYFSAVGAFLTILAWNMLQKRRKRKSEISDNHTDDARG